MDPGGRVERDQKSGAQQQQAGDEPGTGGQWDTDTPASRGQGQWQDDTGQQQRPEVRGQGAGRFSSGEGFTSDETSGSADPRAAQAERDDDLAGAGQWAKPSVTSRAMGTAEKLAGKITRDPGMQARGEERKEGLYSGRIENMQ